MSYDAGLYHRLKSAVELMMGSKPFGERAYSAWIQIQPITTAALSEDVHVDRETVDALVVKAALRVANPLQETEYEGALPSWGPLSNRKLDLRGREREEFLSAIMAMYENVAMVRGDMKRK